MRVMIAETSGLFRELLVELLVGRGLELTGQAETAAQLLSLLDSSPPDVVLLDIHLTRHRGDEWLRAIREIRACHPDIGLLVLSNQAEASDIAEAACIERLLEHAGRAVGYLVRDRVAGGEQLVDAVRQVAAGHVVIDPEVVGRMMSRRATDPLRRLTHGERQVLTLMSEGHSNMAIARRMRSSHKTVEKHTTAIASKLGLPQPGDVARRDVNVRVLAVLAFLRGTGMRGGMT